LLLFYKILVLIISVLYFIGLVVFWRLNKLVLIIKILYFGKRKS